ncbi:MAG: hypothetical protein HYX91_00780 [Chloroflexi bacterium]|nr:hypothetical protein [Chloroflexota bacterium]
MKLKMVLRLPKNDRVVMLKARQVWARHLTVVGKPWSPPRPEMLQSLSPAIASA